MNRFNTYRQNSSNENSFGQLIKSPKSAFYSFAIGLGFLSFFGLSTFSDVGTGFRSLLYRTLAPNFEKIEQNGVSNIEDCNGTFALDGTHTINNYTTTQFSSTASSIQYDINLINGITFDTTVGPNLSNTLTGPPSPYNNSQNYLWLEINTDQAVDNHGTFTITFPGVVINPTIYFGGLSSNTTSPNWSLSLINQTAGVTMNAIYTDGDFQIVGDTIRAAENTATNGSGLVEFTGVVSQLQFQIGHYSESNLDGPVRFALNMGYTLCNDKDGDGIADIHDLDDDNDGIPDIDECANLKILL